MLLYITVFMDANANFFSYIDISLRCCDPSLFNEFR